MKHAFLAGLLASAAIAPPACAEDLGRLFFTPEQRAALDARRKARVPDKPAAAPVVASPTTRVDGYVKRSGGPSTVWLNSEPVTEQGADAPRIRGGRDSRVDVQLGEDGSRVPMKPGQVVNRETGEVRDVLGGGELKVRPSPTRP